MRACMLVCVCAADYVDVFVVSGSVFVCCSFSGVSVL